MLLVVESQKVFGPHVTETLTNSINVLLLDGNIVRINDSPFSWSPLGEPVIYDTHI